MHSVTIQKGQSSATNLNLHRNTSFLAFAVGTATVLVVTCDANDTTALLLPEHLARLRELWTQYLARTCVRADVPDLQPRLGPCGCEGERVIRRPRGREDLALSSPCQ